MRATSKKERLSAEIRLELALRALYFLVYHRIHVESVAGYKLDDHFISDQCYHNQVLRAARVAMTLVTQALTDPDLPFTPWQHGEAWLERIFGQARTGGGNDHTFSIAQMVDRLQRAD